MDDLADQYSRQPLDARGQSASPFPAGVAGDNQPPIPAGQSGRLQLAEWLAKPDHPLTSRVMANRLWRWHFGRGIVPSTDNFGQAGRDAHESTAARLAGLALRPRRLVRERHASDDMLSSTYQMSSNYDEHSAEVDPENSLLWRSAGSVSKRKKFATRSPKSPGEIDLKEAARCWSIRDRQYVANTSKKGGTD